MLVEFPIQSKILKISYFIIWVLMIDGLTFLHLTVMSSLELYL